MKRLIIYVAMMLVTFAVGVGIPSFLAHRQVDDGPPVEVLSVTPIVLSQPLPTQAQLFEPITSIPVESRATQETILILDYDEEKFNPWAVFRVMGDKPNEFDGIDSIELGLYRADDNQQGYLSLVACDSGANCDSADGTFALVSQQRLFFATSQMSNTEFEYWFDGRFLRTDFEAVEGKQIAVLRGTLTKTKNGRKIAEHTFNFRMQHLGC